MYNLNSIFVSFEDLFIFILHLLLRTMRRNSMKLLLKKNAWIISLFLIGFSHATCFDDREELILAVHDYLRDSSPGTPVAQKYGWPIGQWCVSNVTDFSKIFFNQTEFNEDISEWDTSQAKNMHGMFEMATRFNQPLDS